MQKNKLAKTHNNGFLARLAAALAPADEITYRHAQELGLRKHAPKDQPKADTVNMQCVNIAHASH